EQQVARVEGPLLGGQPGDRLHQRRDASAVGVTVVGVAARGGHCCSGGPSGYGHALYRQVSSLSGTTPSGSRLKMSPLSTPKVCCIMIGASAPSSGTVRGPGSRPRAPPRG